MRHADPDENALFRSNTWLFVGAICFTIGASLLVAASTLALHLIVEGGHGLVGSERLRGVLALVAFAAVIAIPVTSLVIATAESDGG